MKTPAIVVANHDKEREVEEEDIGKKKMNKNTHNNNDASFNILNPIGNDNPNTQAITKQPSNSTYMS